MANINILTTGRLGKQFSKSVKREYNDYINVDHYDIVDQQILNKYKYAACFSLPEDLDISHLEWIHSLGAGVDAFIWNPSLNPATKISRTVGFMGRKMAEYCLAYMLADNLKIRKNLDFQEKKLWDINNIRNLFRTAVAILGTGEMGRRVGETFKKMGCKVYGISRSGKAVPEFNQCFTLQQFIESPPEIDTLISILPSNRNTAGLLDQDFFRNLSAIHLINVGRGDVIKEGVLIDLLAQGKLRKATLDVFAREPLPPESQLWQHEKIIITPHQAAITDINDVMLSFKEAFAAWKKAEKSDLFVNISKEY